MGAAELHLGAPRSVSVCFITEHSCNNQETLRLWGDISHANPVQLQEIERFLSSLSNPLPKSQSKTLPPHNFQSRLISLSSFGSTLHYSKNPIILMKLTATVRKGVTSPLQRWAEIPCIARSVIVLEFLIGMQPSWSPEQHPWSGYPCSKISSRPPVSFRKASVDRIRCPVKFSFRNH